MTLRSIDFNGHCPTEPTLPNAAAPGDPEILPLYERRRDWPQLPSGGHDLELGGAA